MANETLLLEIIEYFDLSNFTEDSTNMSISVIKKSKSVLLSEILVENTVVSSP